MRRRQDLVWKSAVTWVLWLLGPEPVWTKPGTRPCSAPCARTHTQEGLAHRVPSGVPSEAPRQLLEAVWALLLPHSLSACCLAVPICCSWVGRGLRCLWGWLSWHGLSPHPAETHRSPFVCDVDPTAAQEREGLWSRYLRRPPGVEVFVVSMVSGPSAPH